MDINKSQKAFAELQDIKFYDKDLKLLSKVAPHSRVLKLAPLSVDKQKSHSDIIWALLQRVSGQEILKNRGQKSTAGDRLKKKAIDIIKSTKASKEIINHLVQQFNEHEYFNNACSKLVMSQSEFDKEVKKVEKFIDENFHLSALEVLVVDLKLNDDEAEGLKKEILTNHLEELKTGKLSDDTVLEILGTSSGDENKNTDTDEDQDEGEENKNTNTHDDQDEGEKEENNTENKEEPGSDNAEENNQKKTEVNDSPEASESKKKKNTQTSNGTT